MHASDTDHQAMPNTAESVIQVQEHSTYENKEGTKHADLPTLGADTQYICEICIYHVATSEKTLA